MACRLSVVIVVVLAVPVADHVERGIGELIWLPLYIDAKRLRF